jgi:hypothetical protein
LAISIFDPAQMPARKYLPAFQAAGFSAVAQKGQPASGAFVLFLFAQNVAENGLATGRHEPVQDILVVDPGLDNPHGFHHHQALTDKIPVLPGSVAYGSQISIDKTAFGQGAKDFDIVIGQNGPGVGLVRLAQLGFDFLDDCGRLVASFLLDIPDIAPDMFDLRHQTLHQIVEKSP